MLLQHILSIALAFLLLLTLNACGVSAIQDEEQEQEEEILIPVAIAKVDTQDVSAYYGSTASLVPKEQAEVVAQVSGELAALHAEEGDIVVKGDLLAKLDTKRYQLELNSADARLNKLQSELKRLQRMSGRGLVSQDQIEKLQFDIAATKADYDLIKLNVEYGSVRSPINGVVSKRHVKVGNMINANASLFTVTEFSPLHAVLHVPESKFHQLQIAQMAKIQVDAYGEKLFQGQVERISPTVDAASGTFEVIVQIANKDRALKPGMFSRIQILYDTHKGSKVINRQALITEDNRFSVFVIENDIALKKYVQTGLLEGDKIEILEGLDIGEQVVISGQNNLKNDSRVAITKL